VAVRGGSRPPGSAGKSATSPSTECKFAKRLSWTLSGTTASRQGSHDSSAPNPNSLTSPTATLSPLPQKFSAAEQQQKSMAAKGYSSTPLTAPTISEKNGGVQAIADVKQGKAKRRKGIISKLVGVVTGRPITSTTM
jgi:hypothetical protein